VPARLGRTLAPPSRAASGNAARFSPAATNGTRPLPPQLVKEALCELELPYKQVRQPCCGLEGAPKRAEGTPQGAGRRGPGAGAGTVRPWPVGGPRPPRLCHVLSGAGPPSLRAQVTVSRGSPKRQELLEKRGTFQVGGRAGRGAALRGAARQGRGCGCGCGHAGPAPIHLGGASGVGPTVGESRA
jgi:hypothetical protein